MSTSGWRRRKNWTGEKLRQHECGRKVAYHTWVDARQAMYALPDDGKGRMSVYECPHCGEYHIGHIERKMT